MSHGTMPNLYIHIYSIRVSCSICFFLVCLVLFSCHSFLVHVDIGLFFLVAMCVLCDFYRFFNALGAPKTHKKKTGTDETRPLGSAISFSNHYTIGILKKSAAGRRIGYLAHETCKNFLAPLLSKLSAEESWKEKALRTVEAFTQQLTTHNRRPSSTKTNRQLKLKHIIILAFIAP